MALICHPQSPPWVLRRPPEPSISPRTSAIEASRAYITTVTLDVARTSCEETSKNWVVVGSGHQVAT
ncbi:hypothetical protein OROMI_027136 [Orobanche minor]